MTALRKLLREDRDLIKTIPGRGYIFAGEVKVGQPYPADQRGHDGPATLSKPPAFGFARPPQSSTGPQVEGEDEQPPVVVIDDDDDLRAALDGLLRSAGFRVQPFSSVQAFLDSAPVSPPACIVLDVWLPEEGGLEFQADLAAAGIDVPIIFVSGYADVQTSVRAMKAGAFEFLTKPVRYQELLDAVSAASKQRAP
jgi:DNA-binding response OmpR family regulator